MLDLLSFKMAASFDKVNQLFRDDFKRFVVDAKLKELDCPVVFDQSPRFCSLFIALECGIFAHLDEATDSELHSLIRSVPLILLSQYTPETYEDFLGTLGPDQIEAETEDLSLEQLSTKIDSEFELQNQLVKRRLKAVRKAQELHPE